MKLLCVCVVPSTIIVEKERYGINENVTKLGEILSACYSDDWIKP